MFNIVKYFPFDGKALKNSFSIYTKRLNGIENFDCKFINSENKLIKLRLSNICFCLFDVEKELLLQTYFNIFELDL